MSESVIEEARDVYIMYRGGKIILKGKKLKWRMLNLKELNLNGLRHPLK